MPVLDMPLKALQEYRGSSPKPEDFDSYWERALEEMNRINPDLEDINFRYLRVLQENGL